MRPVGSIFRGVPLGTQAADTLCDARSPFGGEGAGDTTQARALLLGCEHGHHLRERRRWSRPCAPRGRWIRGRSPVGAPQLVPRPLPAARADGGRRPSVFHPESQFAKGGRRRQDDANHDERDRVPNGHVNLSVDLLGGPHVRRTNPCGRLNDEAFMPPQALGPGAGQRGRRARLTWVRRWFTVACGARCHPRTIHLCAAAATSPPSQATSYGPGRSAHR